MRKEYSDLSDKQKLLYIKREIVIITMTFVPLIIIIGVIIGVASMFDFPEWDKENDMYQHNGTHIIIKDDITKRDKIDKHNLHVTIILLILILIITTFSLVWLGGNLGIWIANKKGWVTDFTLERKEKELKRIKEALEK